MKYIDAEKLKTEIKRLKETHERNLNKPMERGRIGHAHGYIDCCVEILSLIESPHQEQPEADLNEETLSEEFHAIDGKCFDEGIEGWQREKLIARHFYELGLNTRKEK